MPDRTGIEGWELYKDTLTVPSVSPISGIGLPHSRTSRPLRFYLLSARSDKAAAKLSIDVAIFS